MILRRRSIAGPRFSISRLPVLRFAEIHPLPSREKSLNAAKFGRDSSSRYQPAVAAGYDSVQSGVALHRYVTSGIQTTPVDHVTSSTTRRQRLSAPTVTVALILLNTARCRLHH